MDKRLFLPMMLTRASVVLHPDIGLVYSYVL